MAKQKFRTKKNTRKIAEVLSELNLAEGIFNSIVRETGIRLVDGQKNIDIQDVARIRAFLKEQTRRKELKRQTVSLPSIVRVQDLAVRLELPLGTILATLLKNGVVANLNDDLDYETAAIISEELGYTTKEAVEELEKEHLTVEKLDELLKKEDPTSQEPRPPVVTILGHVDHGKTTLLDSIRSSNIAAGEAGGITQAISSYQVKHKNRLITFIDTPGHETFDFMRQRGARLADIAVLVVAADDGVKPQTKEAAEYAKREGIPIVVAINKIDRPGANVEKTKKELSAIDLIPEEWGGKTTMVEISALKKTGIEDLLEIILLSVDLNPPKADPKRAALGTVIESRLDKNLGPLATVLVHSGTLKPGDYAVIGTTAGHVRRLLDWKNKDTRQARPGTPVTIIGLKQVPRAGDILQVADHKEELISKEQHHRGPLKKVSKSDEDDDRKTLALVIKADSQGSLEAVRQMISAMVPESIRLSIIRADVGSISDSDVLTAKAASAIIYGFNTKPAGMSQKFADREGVAIQTFDIIYRLSDDVRLEIEKRLPTEIVREDLGRIKILKVFFSTPKRKIVGGEVAEGTVEPQTNVNIFRGKGSERERTGYGKITELQIEKHAIQKASLGDQVGLTIETKEKIKEGDVLEVYRESEVRKTAPIPG